jgi:hypothetical protein
MGFVTYHVAATAALGMTRIVACGTALRPDHLR